VPLHADTRMIGRDYFGLLPNGYYYRKDVRKSLPHVADAWKASWAAALAQNQRRAEPASARRGSQQPDYQRGPANGAPGYSNQGVPYPGAAQQPGPYNGPPGTSLPPRWTSVGCRAGASAKAVRPPAKGFAHNICLTAYWWASLRGRTDAPLCLDFRCTK